MARKGRGTEMHAGVMVFSGAAFVLIGFALVGGPMILVYVPAKEDGNSDTD